MEGHGYRKTGNCVIKFLLSPHLKGFLLYFLLSTICYALQKNTETTVNGPLKRTIVLPVGSKAYQSGLILSHKWLFAILKV